MFSQNVKLLLRLVCRIVFHRKHMLLFVLQASDLILEANSERSWLGRPGKELRTRRGIMRKACTEMWCALTLNLFLGFPVSKS